MTMRDAIETQKKVLAEMSALLRVERIKTRVLRLQRELP